MKKGIVHWKTVHGIPLTPANTGYAILFVANTPLIIPHRFSPEGDLKISAVCPSVLPSVGPFAVIF